MSRSPFSLEVGAKAEEFRRMGRSSKEDLFGELCFCILAANTSAEMGLKTQLMIGNEGFLTWDEDRLRNRLKEVKYRFYNLRSRFIVSSRWVLNKLPDLVASEDPDVGRDFLVENVMGIGYKEASHFLRNVGIFRFAILDKHILKMLLGPGSKNQGKVSSPKRYREVEKEFTKHAQKLGLEPGILDLYMWKIATGKMIK